MADTMESLRLNGSALTLRDVEEVARCGRRIELADEARAAMEATHTIVQEHAAGGEAIYGVNTGFGSLSRQRISPEQVREVQRNLVRSHAAGVGEPLPDDVVRAMMVILAASLARGKSGVRPIVLERIIDLLNAGITPVVPSRGSVGASGDLAPLAHIALTLMGEGRARHIGKEQPAGFLMKGAHLEPIELDAKEGLALINGTHQMSAMAALAVADVERVQHATLAAAAMAIDACRGTDKTLDPRIHEARNQPGQCEVAQRLRNLLEGSEIVKAHQVDDPRVQDPYCLRATPQVLGAAWDAIKCVRGAIECELGAVTDNPLVFTEAHHNGQETNDEYGYPLFSAHIVSGANFHGMPVAIPLDVLPIALAHIAGIAERRVYWLLAASDSENPVNVYLSPQPGLHSGLMIAQYTAAACCNELQTLCTPASVANIPTSAGIEDYNSMGVTAAHQAVAAVELVRNVIGIELLVMAEAMEYQRPLKGGAGVERTYEIVRSVVPKLTKDRPPAPDIAKIAELIRRDAFPIE